MTATYDNTLPTLRDRIRLTLGDTDVAIDPETSESGAWIEDETYDALIAAAASDDAALLASAQAALARISQDPTSYGEEGMSVAWENKVKALTELINGLTKKLAAAASAISGQTVASRPTRSDRTSPEYRRPDDWRFSEG